MLTLVTGAGGFLGGHLVAALRARGEAVRALDLDFPAPLPECVERCVASITDDHAVAEATRGVDAVIHAAAIAGLWTRNPFDYHHVNVAGTCRVLAAARTAGARVVHVSSYTTLIGGAPEPEQVVNEEVELTPSEMLGPYPRSKREAELAALGAAAAGHDVVVVMPSAPVGPGDDRVTPPTAMIRDLAAGRTPALIDCLINLVDVRALAAGIIAARDGGRAGERYLLSGTDLDISDLAARVAALTGVPAPRRKVPIALALAAARAEALVARVSGRPPRAPLTGVRLAMRRRRFDCSRARSELGYDPGGIDAALIDAIAWMRAEGILPPQE